MSTRFDYIMYDEHAKEAQAVFKQKFSDLADMVERFPHERTRELALTHLEESYMWVGKAIRDMQIEINEGVAKLEEERGLVMNDKDFERIYNEGGLL